MFDLKINKMVASLAHRLALVPTSVWSVTRGFRRLSLFGAVGALALALCNQAVGAGNPEADPTYFNGQTYYMIGAHMINHPNPHLFASSEELYLVAYPINPNGLTNLGSLTLPSGYQPGCDPCFRPGLNPMFAYFDQIVGGAPGMGKNGTAGVYEGPWKVILMMYNPTFTKSANFTPIKSVAGLKAGEANGEFLEINPNQTKGPNPYEIQTGKVMICPLVSPNA